MGFFIYVLIPALLESGWSGPYAVMLPLGSGFGLMFAMTYVGLKRESSIPAWRRRLRLTFPSFGDVAWGVALGLSMTVAIVFYEGFVQAGILVNLPIQPPQWFLEVLSASGSVFGTPGLGRWDFLLLHLLLFSLNIFGEELLFRGYLLPRQERTGGGHAWVLNGVQWTVFHWVWFHLLPIILPISLLLAWVTSRRKSTWCAIIGHGMLNGMAVMGTLLTVLGWRG